MKQIIYVMQFRGHAAPSSENPNVLNASTTAPSCNLRTAIVAEGVSGSIELTGGGFAAFESEVTLTGGTGFQESGMIIFGDSVHRLLFSSR